MGVKLKAKFFIYFLSLFLCLSIIPTIAQKNDSLEELNNRVKILEGQKENLDKQSELLQDKFDIETKDFSTIAKEIKVDQKINNWIVYLIGFFGIGSLISFWGLVKKHIEKKVKEKAEKLINEVYKEKEREILEMAKKQNEEFQLKEKKSILIISKNKDEEPFMEKFFNDMEFSTPEHQSLREVNNLKKFDLILFNNEKQEIDHSDILNIITKTKFDTLCFYFGSDRFDGKEFKDRVNFANSRVQLYGNLINSLRYQSLLK